MNRLKEARKSVKLTQQEVANYIGISQNCYSNWETGRNNIDSESLNKLSRLFGKSVDFLIGESIPEPSTGGVWVPVLGDVAAGIPIEAIENIIDYEEIPKELASQGEFFALRIKGDSMVPRMLDGDVVIVKQQQDCETGDVAVVLVNGESATVKLIKKMPNGIMLKPFNANFDPMFYSKEDIAKLPVRIIGRVVELRGKF